MGREILWHHRITASTAERTARVFPRRRSVQVPLFLPSGKHRSNGRSSACLITDVWLVIVSQWCEMLLDEPRLSDRLYETSITNRGQRLQTPCHRRLYSAASKQATVARRHFLKRCWDGPYIQRTHQLSTSFGSNSSEIV